MADEPDIIQKLSVDFNVVNDLSNSIVSSITKDWITFEFKLDSTQSANTPGTIAIANLTFELF